MEEGISIGQVVRLTYPGYQGYRVRVIEDMGDGTYALEFADGLADVFSCGWFEPVSGEVGDPVR